jgi:hypothetical protein
MMAQSPWLVGWGVYSNLISYEKSMINTFNRRNLPENIKIIGSSDNKKGETEVHSLIFIALVL